MGPNGVELHLEAREGALLGPRRRARRRRGLRFERAVHAFMAPVLIGAPGHNALRPDAQLYPAHTEGGEAARGAGGERAAVIGAQTLRQTVGCLLYTSPSPRDS